MNMKKLMASFVLSALAAGALYANQQLSSGKYRAQISPAPDKQTAENIEKGLDAIQQISSIKVNAKDASVRFKVKDNEQVDVAQLQDAVKAASPDARMSTPRMEEETKGTSGSMGGHTRTEGVSQGGSNSNY